jgi:hypothetical protein
MRLRLKTATTILFLSLASCGVQNGQVKKQPLPLTEPPLCLIQEKQKEKCECALFSSTLEKKVKRSVVVIIGENHAWVAHYGDIASSLYKLYERGVRKIFIELDESLNKLISEYQYLRRTLTNNENLTTKEREKILTRLQKLSNAISGVLIDAHDVAKPWYLMVLIERAADAGIDVVCIDMPYQKIEKKAKKKGFKIKDFVLTPEGLDERDNYMAKAILKSLKKDEKALVLVGLLHASVLKELLNKTITNVDTINDIGDEIKDDIKEQTDE